MSGRAPSNLVAGAWRPIPGDSIVSRNPAHPSRVVWSGAERVSDVGDAVDAARAALDPWWGIGINGRAEVLRAFGAIAGERKNELAAAICAETGKALWESSAEAGLIAGKVDITLEEGVRSGRHRVDAFEFGLGAGKTARCHFRPHGVMAVVGPFNFPAHLPNGHIVPALLAGNTVVFKPSDKAPGVGQMLGAMYHDAMRRAGAPDGVVQVVQGGARVATALVGHDGIDGVLFTGSWAVGRRILEANLDRPGRIVALEMGGNNPAVVMHDADLHQAVVEIVRCAFNTTGQRCTCTRRLIVHEAVAERVIAGVVRASAALVVGDPRSEHPVFMGPIISEEARDAVLDAQRRWRDAGAAVLLEAKRVEGADGWFVTPGVLRVARFDASEDGCGGDEEVFGPLLRISVVGSLEEAIEQANATKYGLAASIFTGDAATQELFLARARAGCVNINCGTAGASSKLPFGGVGASGNHRPAGAFSLDYCAYPVATMIETGGGAAVAPGMRVDPDWTA